MLARQPPSFFNAALQYAVYSTKNFVSSLTSPGGVSVTMGGCARLGARRWAAFAGAAFFCVAAIFSLPFKASAQNTAIIRRGDAAVTAFSGARQLGEVPSGLHPLDVTFIDVNAPCFRCST